MAKNRSSGPEGGAAPNDTERLPGSEPQGEVGVAAPPSSPSGNHEFVGLFDSRVGVCLHYDHDGQSVRENLTEGRCEERISAFTASGAEGAAAFWRWKLEQIQTMPLEPNPETAREETAGGEEKAAE